MKMQGTVFETSTRLVLVVFSIAVLAPAPAASSPSQSQELGTGTVRVSVIGADTGRPLAGARVQVLDMTSAEIVAEAVTSNEGNAEIVGVPFGVYQVSAVPPEGYVRSSGPLVTVGSSRPTVAVNLSLVPLRSGSASTASSAAILPNLPVLLTVAIIGGAALTGVLLITRTAKDVTP